MQRAKPQRNRTGLVLALLTSLLASLAVLAAQGGPAGAALPGQNGSIAFERFGDVYLAAPDGANARKVDVAGVQANPAVSPDGTRVAYEFGRGIWAMNTDGTGQRRVSGGTNSTPFADSDPAWSSDGKSLIFSRYQGGDSDLWRVNLDATGERQLTSTPDHDEIDPAPSPAGTEIAYTRVGCEPPDGGLSCVFKMRSDGTGQVNLTPEDRLPECPNQPGYFHRGASSEPSWSADGTRIAFRGTVSCPRTSGTDIWVMSSDGSGKLNVTNDGGNSDHHPSFSPDGTKIAFSSSRPSGDPVAVYLVGAGGGTVARLAPSTGFDNDPDWGPLDAVRPTITRVTPANLARNVAPGANVAATLSEPMERSSLNGTTVYLRLRGTTAKVPAAVTYDAANRRAVLDPARPLRAGATYVATVGGESGGPKDLAGNPLAAGKTWSFAVRR